MTKHDMIYTTAKQMEKLDEVAVGQGLEIRQMMELAGFAMLQVFEELRISKEVKIAVLVGKGNKGGDGLSAARHLFNHGWKNLEVVLTSKGLKPDPQHHLELIEKMSVNIKRWPTELSGQDVIIDALIGYHLEGAPREPALSAIGEINDSKAMVVAYDLPSGMDATTGECEGECVRAHATLTLAAPKKCFQTFLGKKNSGRLFLADIGIPEFLYREVLDKYTSPFEGEGVIEVKG